MRCFLLCSADGACKRYKTSQSKCWGLLRYAHLDGERSNGGERGLRAAEHDGV
jgi:hypothetical protein